jgi:aspartate kinase
LPEVDERIPLAVESHHGKIIVSTGFIGKARNGDITTLGRGGSDFSAAIFGAALNAREIQIWTDVDGVMTSNPKMISNARPVERMTFAEASELAYYGGKVLHPATMIPAVRKDIPIRVLNTHNPEHPGTVIVGSVPEDRTQVKCVSYKTDVTLVDVVSSRMLGQSGFMSWLFNLFAKHQVVIGMISTSEVTVSLTTENSASLKKAVQELEESDFTDEVAVEHGKCIVSVIGSGMKHQRGLAAKIFRAVADAGVNIQFISQGASEVNIVMLVDNEEAKPCVQSIHDLYIT